MTNGLKIIIIFDYKILIFVLEIEPRRNWLLIYSIVIFSFTSLISLVFCSMKLKYIKYFSSKDYLKTITG